MRELQQEHHAHSLEDGIWSAHQGMLCGTGGALCESGEAQSHKFQHPLNGPGCGTGACLCLNLGHHKPKPPENPLVQGGPIVQLLRHAMCSTAAAQTESCENCEKSHAHSLCHEDVQNKIARVD